MTTAAHTPAPWKVYADGVKVGEEDGFQPFDSCGCCDSPWVGGDTEEVKIANARLMVAAPKLLAALQGVLRVADRQTEEFDAARAAIAEATGAAA